jgi:hypothetical protein
LGNSATTELGYGLSEMIVLGGFLQLGGNSETRTDEDDNEVEVSDFSFFLGPKIDIMFSEGAKLRPFVGAAIGYATGSSEEDAPNDLEDEEFSVSGPQLMLRGGLRVFASGGLSIDPQLVFSYATLSGDADFGPVSVDIDASLYSIGLAVVLSGWLK